MFLRLQLDFAKNMHYYAYQNPRGTPMAGEDRVLAGGASYIDFQTEPSRYRHWKLDVDGEVATLTMDVDENGGLFEGYQLKLNSYDLGVDIELADAVQRLRFEHPGVKVVLLRSGKNRVFCAGANIRMLAGATHAHKVNFCKFTNETRNGLEDSSENSGQHFISVINGTAAGGGYELALATDHIMLADDGAASVALPEVPLLAVLPGTGGLTRVVDKRKVRRDHADYFCTIEEGVKGKRAVQWRLVDEIVPNSKLEARVSERARQFAAASKRNGIGQGIALTPLDRSVDGDGIRYGLVSVDINRAERIATITIRAPDAPPPADIDGVIAQGASFWPLQVARELDDAILHLRINELQTALLLFKSHGERANVVACDALLETHKAHWLVNEIRQYWKRVLKRIDVTSRTLVTLVEPGSCFAGTLAELVFAADRSYMLIGQKQGDNRAPPTLELTAMNFGPYPMSHGLTRLQSRYQADPSDLDRVCARIGEAIDAEEAEALGLVTFALDDIDWDDEIRVFLEERTSFSPDGLTGMEANLRFVGPETMESKIFSRLTAWQNWIFQRPNAVGEDGALRRYGSGQKAQFDMTRV
jgi:benzoyl-CoA-dihydrodiol lyase